MLKYRSVLAEMLADQGLDIELDILELKGVRDYVVASALDYMRDSELPIEDRWRVYLCIESFLPEDPWVRSFKQLNDDTFSWYDDFYKDRYSFVEYAELIDVVETKKQDRYITDTKWGDVDVDALKEEIMSLGTRGFTYDW